MKYMYTVDNFESFIQFTWYLGIIHKVTSNLALFPIFEHDYISLPFSYMDCKQ